MPVADEPPLTPSPLRPIRATAPIRRASVVAIPAIAVTILVAALVLRGQAAEPVASPSLSASSPSIAASASGPLGSASPRPSNGVPAAIPSFAPPGRMDVPFQTGTATHAMIVVDTSTVDEATAAWIRESLVDLVHQLAKYDSLTVLASSDKVHLVVDNATLDGAARDAAIASIEKLEFGGARHLVAGMQAAIQQAVKAGAGSYPTLFIATGSDGTTIDQLQSASRVPTNGTGSTNIGLKLHFVAVGAGEHEALLSRGNGTYQWARTGADLSLAFAPFRLAISEATLLAIGPVPAGGETAKALIAPFHFGVRFTTYSRGRAVGFEAVSPSGKVFDVDTKGDDVTVQQFGDRVSIVVNGADEGEWQMRFNDPSAPTAGAWFEAEETLTLTDPLLTAYGTGDTTNELKLGVGLPVGAKYTASARIVAADGGE
jgi:hypothetical protein